MRYERKCARAVFGAASALLLVPLVSGQTLAGRWQGTVKVNGLEIPFQIELKNDSGNLQATLFNGEERFTSTSGRLAGESLVVKWDYFASTLKAVLRGNDELDGEYTRTRGEPYAFHARRFTAARPALESIPYIAGLWEIHDVASSKGEAAWQFIVRQSDAGLSAAILRVDGDTGTLSGTFMNGKFTLSHFSGLRPALLEVTPQPDGTLKLVLNAKNTMTAVRPAEARAKNLPEPADPSKHTSVKDASQPFHFSFPDLDGKLVSDTDARFHNKVVLINITGSWCPNCHDEAPFLAELYRKYRAQGLEIVGLSFEEADQLKNPTRLRAFLARYGIEYTVLLCGTTDEAKQKLSQAENWDAWPTTFFAGRDGRVRKVHAGFPSKASGDLYTKAAKEFTDEVERLLAENALTLR
jgi:peroxiredoxin